MKDIRPKTGKFKGQRHRINIMKKTAKKINLGDVAYLKGVKTAKKTKWKKVTSKLLDKFIALDKKIEKKTAKKRVWDWTDKIIDLKDWEERFEKLFFELELEEARADKIPLINKSDVKRFFRKEIEKARQEGFEEGKKEPHGTINNYCCACEYDQAVFKAEVKKSQEEAIEEVIEVIEKINPDEMFAEQLFAEIKRKIKELKT